jgi:hypothetical protein
MGPDDFTIEEDLKQKLIMSETSINVEYEEGEIKIIE